MISDIIGAFWPYIAALGATAVALVVTHFKSKAAGREQERQKIARQEQKARDTASNIDRQIDAADPAKNREELRKWS